MNLSLKEQKLFYNSIIKAIMLYGSMVLGYCSNESIDKILKLQKRAAHVILDVDMKERSSVMFKKPNWLLIRHVNAV